MVLEMRALPCPLIEHQPLFLTTIPKPGMPLSILPSYVHLAPPPVLARSAYNAAFGPSISPARVRVTSTAVAAGRTRAIAKRFGAAYTLLGKNCGARRENFILG